MTATTHDATPARTPDPDSVAWTGPTRNYDIVKEFVVALVVVTLLTVLMAGLFSSPDDTSVTTKAWVTADRTDFVTTALSELDGTSGVATYGQPYNNTSGAAQKIGPISLQSAMGVQIPIDTAQDFVLGPLSQIPNAPLLTDALAAWNAATPAQQSAWTTAYSDALTKAMDVAKVPPGPYGPVEVMMISLADFAATGGLDSALTAGGSYYQTNYTKPLLFLSDGSYLESLATSQHLLGDQWGMMNESGNWPGQPWLWLYTFWYQIKPFTTSGNADALVWAIMMVLSLLLILVPFLPGIRSIPRVIPLYRLIWRDWYRDHPQVRPPPRR